MKAPRGKDDFRGFVFTATGEGTSLEDFGPLDVYDNLIAELDRLCTLIELLTYVDPNGAEGNVLPGLGLLLKDIHDRMKTILAIGLNKPPKKGKRS